MGRIFYANGDVYIGEVQDFKRYGAGRLYQKKEKRYFEGKFYNGNKEGMGYYIYNSEAASLAGKVYCGNFKNDKEEGAGEYISEKDMVNVYGLEWQGLNERLEEIKVFLSNGFKNLGLSISDLIKK